MKKNQINKLLLGSTLLASLAIISCKDKSLGEPAPEHFAISSVELHPTSFDALNDTICLLIGKELQLSCDIFPANSTNPRLKWSSSDESIVSVSQDGHLVAHEKVGRAILRIAPEIGFGPSATTPSRVIKVVNAVDYVSAIHINGGPVKDIYEGEKFQLTYSVTPINATYPICEWISSDPTIATINRKGEVSLLKHGSVTFTARSTDVQAVPNGNPAVEESFTLSVLQSIPIESVTLTAEPLLSTMGYGQNYQLKYTLVPANATAAMLTWSSSNTDAIDVSGKGEIVVNARAGVSAEITATAPNGRFSKLTVSVEAGRMVYSFKKIMLPWTLGQSATFVPDGIKSVVTMGVQNPTKNRGDLILASGSKPNSAITLHPSVYKIFAVKLRSNSSMSAGNNSGGAMSLDITGGAWNNNTFTVLGSRTIGEPAVVYYDLSSKLKGTAVLEVPLFQIKMADFPSVDGNTYDIYWAQTFKSVADLQAFVDAE